MSYKGSDHADLTGKTNKQRTHRTHSLADSTETGIEASLWDTGIENSHARTCNGTNTREYTFLNQSKAHK